MCGHIYCCLPNFLWVKSSFSRNLRYCKFCMRAKDFPTQISQQFQVGLANLLCGPTESWLLWKWLLCELWKSTWILLWVYLGIVFCVTLLLNTISHYGARVLSLGECHECAVVHNRPTPKVWIFINYKLHFSLFFTKPCCIFQEHK